MSKYIDLDFHGKLPTTDEKIKYKLRCFPCSELEFSIQEDISKYDINVYQTFNVGHFNDDLIKLQIVCNVLKRNNVKTINYFAPFLPYARQDRIHNMTCSLGVKMVAEIINNCSINKVITYDFHTSRVKELFKGSFYNISAIPFFLEDVSKNFDKKDIVIVFPDTGACDKFKQLVNNAGYKIAIINKIRTENGLNMKMFDEVKQKVSIIIDDMIDTGGTINEASKLLIDNGSKDILVYATHGILSGTAIETLENIKEIRKITITNSLVQSHKLSKKFEIMQCICANNFAL